MLAACFGKDEIEESPEEVEDSGTPITPVHAKAHGLKAKLERGQAEIIDTKRKILEAGRAEAERQRIAEEEHAKQAALAREELRKQAAAKTVSRGDNYVGKAQAFQATAYTAYCAGCSGITKTGVNLRKSIYHEGKRVIAVDPRYIPLGSIVRVTLADGVVSKRRRTSAHKRQIIDVAHKQSRRVCVRQAAVEMDDNEGSSDGVKRDRWRQGAYIEEPFTDETH